ncbi:hypothetical protein G3I59_27355 [Amycolatopsis rubida]|uniref:Uncharacterized protein n=1 Tax=Amycolatopsis rubida TaxID=112413 RepID=A0ABX0C2P7_9PSEU|nr:MULTISPECIES: hypothetical protein [Amycolatopsis]MYW94214.1 hypothetical protein [Amycolatopsis rubida]NEC59203.1 hypothetical protein [Amycolatopsis rubida]
MIEWTRLIVIPAARTGGASWEQRAAEVLRGTRRPVFVVGAARSPDTLAQQDESLFQVETTAPGQHPLPAR